MNKINFRDIFKKAGSTTWKSKFLWVLGFFVVIGGALGNISYRGNSLDGSTNEKISLVLSFMERHALFFGLLSLAFLYLRIISQAAMIRALNDLGLYKNLKIAAMLRESRNYFWKLFLVEMLIIVSAMLLFFVLIVPVLVLFIFKSYILGSFVALSALAIFIPIVLLLYSIKQYGWLFAVIANVPLVKALRMAYYLFKKMPNETVKMIFGIFLSGIVFVTGIILLLLLLAMPFLMLEFGMKQFLRHEVLATISIVGIMVGVAALLFAASLYEVFKQSAWVIFFKEISMEKIEKKEELEEVISPVIVSPEGV